MGIHYSYECIEAKNIRKIQYGLFLCDLQFETEHGYRLAPAQDVVVDSTGNIQRGPEDFLAEDTDEKEWEKWWAICRQGDPGYSIYNPEWLAQKIAAV